MCRFPGGVFSSTNWELERGSLHHDDFCHGFYDFIGAVGGASGSTTRQALVECLHGAALPESLVCGFANWFSIANKLHGLFERAPSEGLYADEAQLAYAARASVQLWDDALLGARVSDAADAALLRIAARDAQRVRQRIDELQRIADRIGAFVALCQSGSYVPAGEIDGRVDVFLEDVQALHFGLSALPRSLRGEEEV